MSTGSNSNHHPLHPRDDREALSALFDGELPGDAARFALKRLDHDAGWRETCGRWQLIGDALRGEATTVAPSDFASGVMRVLAEGQSVLAPSASHHAPGAASRVARRRWIGGAALAASVAMAAVLAVRPFSPATAPVSDGQVAAGVVSPATSQAPSLPSMETAAPALAASPVPATRVAAADAQQAPTARRAMRPTRVASRAPRHPVAPAPSPAEAGASVATAAPESARPFHPPVDDVATRPWPRAVLPESAAAGALTVGFGTPAPPSLYPFEPRLPAEMPPAETSDGPPR